LLLNYDGKHPYKIAHNVVSSIMKPKFTFMTALKDKVIRRNEQAAVESLFPGLIELRVVRGKDGKYGKQILVSSSPLPGFLPQEVPYEVVKNAIVMSPPVEGCCAP
jgi:hypothetical protein